MEIVVLRKIVKKTRRDKIRNEGIRNQTTVGSGIINTWETKLKSEFIKISRTADMKFCHTNDSRKPKTENILEFLEMAVLKKSNWTRRDRIRMRG